MEQKSIIIIRVKKKLSYPCHVSFTGATFIFLEMCANHRMLSILTMIYISLVIDGVEVHYNYQSEKN